MNDEIKEILELKRRKIENAEAFGLTSINIQEDKKLLDYITTLQEENERLNNIINELENYIEDKRNYYCETDNEYWSINQILQELKKLKENKQ